MGELMRAAIVVGSAPCLHADLESALVLYPDAFVIAVNGACTSVEKIDVMVAGHTFKAPAFVKARLEAFPAAPLPEVWANWAGPVIRHPHKKPPAKELPMVTEWFDTSHSTGATSAGKAAKMALTKGFEPVIFAGCPLDASGYSFDEARVKHEASCKRVGHSQWDKHKMTLGYRAAMAKLAEGEFRGKVFSMSGFTRNCLGLPPAAQL
jgi:hypothetical protein